MAGSFEGVLANIPGYGGYLAKETYNRNQTLGDIQQMTGIQGMLAKMQEQHRAQQVQSVLADPSIPPEQKRMALIGLMRDPTQAATGMHQIATENANADLRKSQMETQARLLEGEKRKAAQDARVAGASDQLYSLLTPGVSPTDGAQRMPFVGSEAELVQHMQKNPGVYSRVDPAQVRGLQAIIDPKETAKGLLSHGKQDAPYTLSPGAIRFGPNGEQIATAPFAPRVDPAPQIVQTNDGPAMLPRGSTAVTPLTDQSGKPLAPKATEKALPASAANKLLENSANLRKAQEALALIEGKMVGGATGDVAATGLKGYLPESVLQRADSGGIDTRAAIGDLGSMVIHDRSGAAVTAAEFPRLRPFIPLVTDDPETVKKKLGRFVTEYKNVVGETADFYRESGYKVPEQALRGPAAPRAGKTMQIKGDAEYNMLPKGARYVGPDGVERIKP